MVRGGGGSRPRHLNPLAMSSGEGGVNESSPARRSADVTSALIQFGASTSPPAEGIEQAAA